MKLQWKIALSVALVGIITALFVNIVLYKYLHSQGMAEAKQEARQTASLIRTALLNVMISTGGDYKEIEKVIKDIQNEHFMSFRMVKSAHVIKQHGMRLGEEPADPMEAGALFSGKIIESMDNSHKLRIIYPFVTDERCGQCHVDMDGNPVGIGVVNGAAVLAFDLSRKLEEGRSLILYILGVLTLGAFLFLIVILIVIDRTLTMPVMKIAEAIKEIKNENYNITLPEVDTHEINIMAEVVREAAVDLSKRRDDREKVISQERSRAMEIEKFVRGRASSLGLDVESEIPEIMGRLTSAVDEVKKKNMVSRALPYVHEEKSVMTIPSEPDLIPAVSAYIAGLVEQTIGPAKAGSLELTLDEALSNAIYHGNLEVPSQIKADDFDKFYELARERQRETPYCDRMVSIYFDHNRDSLKVRVNDEGEGFDWKSLMSFSPESNDLPHGRGLVLMQALSSRLEFNERGNEVTLHFNVESRMPGR
ncbi:MAG: ATP-binding protein [Nitrospinota bacterium]|nr:ATP-binding protein [Nitrospinota bacterium]